MGFHPHQPFNNIDIRSQADFERDAEKEKLSKGVSSAPSHGRKGCDKAKTKRLEKRAGRQANATCFYDSYKIYVQSSYQNLCR